MLLRTWKNLAKAKFDEPSPVHFRCIFTQAEKEEDQESAAEPDPTVEWHHTAGRNLDDVPPFGTVHEVPRVWEVRNGAVAVKDVELNR